MNIVPTTIAGVVVAETRFRRDERGTFARLLCAEELANVLGEREIVQINLSYTRHAGAIRGMHFQKRPHAEMKLVRCLKGKVWDVAVDLRAGSPTLLQWHAEELSADNARMMILPEGCAHGFQTLVPDCELLYTHTAAHAPESEDGVAWDDPSLGISWPLPLPPSGGISDRDRRLPMLSAPFRGIDT